jgi:hypothetical protein
MRTSAKPNRQEHDKKEANRANQQAYRRRHADALRSARRVATALMRLRASRGRWLGRDGYLALVAQSLAAFLDPAEVKTLVKLLRTQTPTPKD